MTPRVLFARRHGRSREASRLLDCSAITRICISMHVITGRSGGSFLRLAGKRVCGRCFAASQRHRTITTDADSTSNTAPVIFSGIQPTGVPHLGNYLGALHEWVKLQDNAQPGTKLLFSIVDLHALTVPQEASQLRKWRAEAFATLLAVGLDPKKSTIFYQSAVSLDYTT